MTEFSLDNEFSNTESFPDNRSGWSPWLRKIRSLKNHVITLEEDAAKDWLDYYSVLTLHHAMLDRMENHIRNRMDIRVTKPNTKETIIKRLNNL